MNDVEIDKIKKQIEVIKSLVANKKYRDEYENSLLNIDTDLMYLYVNNYTESIHKDVDVLIKSYFGSWSEDVFWFLYEWKSGFAIKTAEGVEYVIGSDEDYYDYFLKERTKESEKHKLKDTVEVPADVYTQLVKDQALLFAIAKAGVEDGKVADIVDKIYNESLECGYVVKV